MPPAAGARGTAPRPLPTPHRETITRPSASPRRQRKCAFSPRGIGGEGAERRCSSPLGAKDVSGAAGSVSWLPAPEPRRSGSARGAALQPSHRRMRRQWPPRSARADPRRRARAQSPVTVARPHRYLTDFPMAGSKRPGHPAACGDSIVGTEYRAWSSLPSRSRRSRSASYTLTPFRTHRYNYNPIN